MTFADKVLDFHFSLKPDWKLPKGFEIIYPFGQADTQKSMRAFYQKYFEDSKPRKFLFGINPGRFGAGVTGIAFTDPFHLKEHCGIDSPFPKRKELSSIFIYELINSMGGPQNFYNKYYITSVCPLGFLTKGINCNYYDDLKLQEKVLPRIIENIATQIDFGMEGSKAYCLGMGKNFKFLKKLNQENNFFSEVIPLPHPRWVLQYKRKTAKKYLLEYKEQLEKT